MSDLNDRSLAMQEPEKTHVVVTATGSNHFISKVQYETFLNMSLDDMLRIDAKGTMVKVASIMEILTVEQYYEQHPDQKPAVYTKMEWLEEVPQGIDGLLANAPKKGLEQMILGMKKFVKANPKAEKAKSLGRRMIALQKTMQS